MSRKRMWILVALFGLAGCLPSVTDPSVPSGRSVVGQEDNNSSDTVCGTLVGCDQDGDGRIDTRNRKLQD